MIVEMLDPLAQVAPSVDAVLVSHPDTEHLGALPYAFGKLGLNCKVYATLPVHKMGLMYMYDHFLSRSYDTDFTLFSLDDVDKAFGSFVPVRYAQHSALEGNGHGISVTAHAAGHMLGATVWKVHKDSEDVLYAIDYNHRKEKHLNGTTLESLKRPSVLITDSLSVTREVQSKTRDDEIMNVILRSVRQDGNVLIPIDPAGRVLELLLLLEENWSQKQLGAYQLVLLSTVAYNTLEFARSHLEWMGENVSRNFDIDRHNVFKTRYLTLCHSIEELHALRPGPKVVLSSFGSLECGASRHLFVEWASDPRNLIILTDRTEPGTLSREVEDLSRQPPAARQPLTIKLSKRVLLEGDELLQLEEQQSDVNIHECTSPLTDADDDEEHNSERNRNEQSFPDSSSSKSVGSDSKTPLSVNCFVRHNTVSTNKNVFNFEELRCRRCLVDGLFQHLNGVADMFDDELWEPDTTDFGETVDASRLVRAATDDLGTAVASLHDDVNSRSLPSTAGILAGVVGDLDSGSPNLSAFPTKVVTKTLEVSLRAAVHVCDFEGRADGRSVRTLISHIEPRRIILVRGSPSDAEHLKTYLKNSLPDARVDVPTGGETIHCTFDTAVYRLALSQDLLYRTRLRDVAGYHVGWVEGQLCKTIDHADQSDMVLRALPQARTLVAGGYMNANMIDSSAVVPEGIYLKKLYEDETQAWGESDYSLIPEELHRQENTAFFGSLKLSELKLSLATHDIAAEFISGALVCSKGSTCVRKNVHKSGFSVLAAEGELSDEFYQIRTVLYTKYQIV